MTRLPRDPDSFRHGVHRSVASGEEFVANKLVRHHETNDLYVVYLPLARADDTTVPYRIREWAKDGAESWTDMIWINGRARPRFVPIADGREVIHCVPECEVPDLGFVVLYRIDDAMKNMEKIRILARSKRVNDDLFLDHEYLKHVDRCVPCRVAIDELKDLVFATNIG